MSTVWGGGSDYDTSWFCVAKALTRDSRDSTFLVIVCWNPFLAANSPIDRGGFGLRRNPGERELCFLRENEESKKDDIVAWGMVACERNRMPF